MTFDRPPVEEYVRCSFQFGKILFEPAIQWCEGDVFAELVDELRRVVHEGTRAHLTDPMTAAKQARLCIATRWPTRAYFVEVWEDGEEGFAQVFQPFGVPRNR